MRAAREPLRERCDGLDGPVAGHGHPAVGSVGRATHGSVRAIVSWVLADKPMHGYQIMTELKQRSDDFWNLSPGSVYPMLQQLADEGLVTESGEEARRVYAPTDAGRTAAQAIRHGHGQTPWLAAKRCVEQRLRLWRAISALVKLAEAAAVDDSAQRTQEVLGVLEPASAQIHAVLVEDSLSET